MIQETPPVTWVDTHKAMMKFVHHVRKTKECAIDTETTGLDRWKDSVIIWSACPSVDSRYCFSRAMLEIYDKELSQDTSIKWYFTNQTFDFCMMHNSGVRVPAGDSYCTLAMDWLYDENRRGGHGLKETAKEYIGLRMEAFKEAFDKKGKETIQERLLRGLKEDFDRSISYASIDAWATFGVFHALKKLLSECASSTGMSYWDYFQKTEMPFTRVLFEMIRRGIMIDSGYLEDLKPKLENDITAIERKIIKSAGKEININSPAQLRWLLFEQLKLKPIKMTKGGASKVRLPSTDKDTLSAYAEDGVEVCQFITEHRGMSKMLGTYVNGLHKWVDNSCRIHPTLTQHVAVTGRLSSVSPNL